MVRGGEWCEGFLVFGVGYVEVDGVVGVGGEIDCLVFFVEVDFE